GRLLALGDLREGLVDRDRGAGSAGQRDLQRDLDVELVVVALVGERHLERLALDVGEPVRGRRRERDAAVDGGVETGTVQARAGRLVLVGAAAVTTVGARGQALAELLRDVLRR